MKTLVLGLGNPILSDDGVGLRVTEELKVKLNQPEVTVMETSMAGLDLLDVLVNFDKVIIIDAIQTRDGKVGQIYRLEPEALDASQHLSTPHDVNFATALELGKKLGLALPQDIIIFAIEVKDITTYRERCTPEVEQVIPIATEMVMQELKGNRQFYPGYESEICV